MTTNSGYADLVRKTFLSWGVNNEPFLQIVADDVTWRIIGTSTVSGTYHSKQEFLEATAPLGARFSRPLRVEIKSVDVADDTLFLQWEGTTEGVNGRNYHQTYCWIIRMADGKAVDVVVYLDTALVDDMFAD